MKDYYQASGRKETPDSLIDNLRNKGVYEEYNYCIYSIDYDDYPIHCLNVEWNSLNTCSMYNKFKVIKNYNIDYYYRVCTSESEIVVHNKYNAFSGFCMQHYYLLNEEDRLEIINLYMPKEMNKIIERYELVRSLI